MSNLNKDNKLEKIYTPEDLTMELVKLAKTHFNGTVKSLLEPAAGSGAMLDILTREFPETPVKAYDIYNETSREDIIQADFLKTPINYSKGVLCVMNPPFSKANKFMNKVMEVSDLCVTITSGSNLLDTSIWYNDLYEVIRVHHKKYVPFADGNKYTINIWILSKKK